MNQLIFLSMLFSITPIPIGLASEPTAFEHTSVISKDELMRFRPANSFRLVYSEDKGVCGTMLNALNEEGYNPQYFNTSPKVKHSLPELLIQTRLNVPRRIIGTHLFRTEEYKLIFNKGNEEKTEYWYRIIGHNLVIIGLSPSIKKSWFEIYNGEFSDFIDFLDVVSLRGRSTFNLMRFKGLSNNNQKIEFQLDEKYSKSLTKMNKNKFFDIISIGNNYYLLSIDDVNLNLIVSKINSINSIDYICIIEPNFVIK